MDPAPRFPGTLSHKKQAESPIPCTCQMHILSTLTVQRRVSALIVPECAHARLCVRALVCTGWLACMLACLLTCSLMCLTQRFGIHLAFHHSAPQAQPAGSMASPSHHMHPFHTHAHLWDSTPSADRQLSKQACAKLAGAQLPLLPVCPCWACSSLSAPAIETSDMQRLGFQLRHIGNHRNLESSIQSSIHETAAMNKVFAL